MEIQQYSGNKAEWDEYVMRSDKAVNYHLSGWKTVIEKSFSHKTYYLIAKDNSKVVGILPLVVMKSFLFGKYIVSLPFFNYGGVLADTKKVAEALLTHAEEMAQEEKVNHIELRHIQSHDLRLPSKRHKVTTILKLEKDVESQWKAFNTKLRNQIRKADKSGLNVKVGTLDELDNFYAVFARNMRDLGTPVYPKRFFQDILETFPVSTKIFAVMLGNKAVAAGLASWFKETCEVPWASSIKDYRNLCPNNLLYWEAIKFSIERGFAQFDFGRSTPGEGAYKFKEQWGAKPVQLYWHYWLSNGQPLPEINPNNPKYRLAVDLWKKMPLALTKLIGPRIVKNIP